MLILCAIVGGLLCLTCFLFLVVHPMVCIFECALSKTLPGSQKALWIAISFFTGIFGSLAYALFASGSPRLRSLTLTGMKLGTVNLLLAIGAFAATPDIREFFSAPFGDLSVESMAFETEQVLDSGAIAGDIESTTTQTEVAPFETNSFPQEFVAGEPAVASTMADSTLKLRPLVETNDPQTASGQQYVAVVTDSLETQTDASVEDNADLFAMLVEEGDIAPAAIEASRLVPESAETAAGQAELAQQEVLSTSEKTLGDQFPVEAPSEIFEVDNFEAKVSALVEQPPLASVLKPQENLSDTVLKSESTAGNAHESASTTNTPLASTTDDPVPPLSLPTETKKSDVVPAQPVNRHAKPATLTTPKESPTTNRINRYRAEGYPVYEVNVSQTPTVRNRYTNQ